MGESPGKAELYEPNHTTKSEYENAGGGMSASENRMANFKGKTIGNPGPPKDTSGGRDLGKNARNVIKSYATSNVGDEVSPAATKQSGNPDQMKSY